jgi:hypothetical protein
MVDGKHKAVAGLTCLINATDTLRILSLDTGASTIVTVASADYSL